MKILVACEESQAVTIELRKLGHEAYSCDIQDCSGGFPEWHLKADVIQLLDEKWDMIIAFPPCTYLSNAGARHLYKGGQLQLDRYEKGIAAKEFFLKILNAQCDKIAIENPIHSKIFDMPPYTQQIEPWMFGHDVTKRTRLWLKGLPPLFATDIVIPSKTYLPSSCSRFKGTGKNKDTKHGSIERSKTFNGIAKAMAQQWTAAY